MEYEYYMDLFASSTTFPPEVDEETQAQLRTWVYSTPGIAYQYANQIIANMPSPRFKSYENSNFQDIQDNVIGYLYPITNYMGPYYIGTNLNLLF